MAPGILAQSMMFISIFYGLSIIWDKDQGILQKLIALPVPRAAFVTGKAFGAGVLAAIVKNRERFMGIGQVITMPLFFASNAIYPIQIMPHWLQIVARINPLSYRVELLRGYLINAV